MIYFLHDTSKRHRNKIPFPVRLVRLRPRSFDRMGGRDLIKIVMGEYAKYNGERIKIGTCENMYYLRADQAHLVQALSGNVNPITQADQIRFRFPFPQEDGIKPGAFDDHDFGLGLYGVEPPDDIEHYNVQFSSQRGLLVSLPCPESKEGKSCSWMTHYNGYSGKVKISQQR